MNVLIRDADENDALLEIPERTPLRGFFGEEDHFFLVFWKGADLRQREIAFEFAVRPKELIDALKVAGWLDADTRNPVNLPSRER